MSLQEFDAMDDELMADLGEGPARFDEGDDDFLDDEGDEFDELDEADEFEEDELDDFDADSGADVDAAMEMMVADALQADDTDEFWRRIRRGIGRVARVARRIGRGIGRVARVVAPIASRIPLPWTQALGRVANVVGRVMADGADEFDALDEMVDLMDEDLIDAAAPLVAGLTIRSAIPRIARAPLRQRRALVRGVARAARTLARRQGPAAVRAIRPVVRAAARTVARGRARPAQLPRVVQALARRVTPRVVQQIALRRPVRARRGVRTLRLRGPVTISIRGGR